MSKCSVCLEHEVQVSVCGCEVSLSLCLYLQMYTFERIVSLLVQQNNWCWHHHGDKAPQTAVCTGCDGSRVHYKYVCTLWRSWIYFVFITMVYDVITARASLNKKAQHWTILWAGTFITFSIILHCIACCSQICRIIIIIIGVWFRAREREFSYLYSFKTASLAHPASWPVSTWACFPLPNVTSTWCQG